MKQITLPLTKEMILDFKAGEEVYLSGEIYVGRDQAHQRLCALIEEGKELPITLQGEVIYYMGPSPTPEGRVIGSAGPTTAGRMDPFAPTLLDLGLYGMIGKGNRSPEVYEAVKRNKAVYFYSYGGCGALYSDRIMKSTAIAFEDLGPEAILRLEVKDFPLLVAIDTEGNSIFR